MSNTASFAISKHVGNGTRHTLPAEEEDLGEDDEEDDLATDDILEPSSHDSTHRVL